MTNLRPAQILFPVKGASESADAYLARLQAPLQALTSFVTAMTSGGAQTVYDTQGRPIQTPQGNFSYGADGSTVIAPDIVQINTQDLVDGAVTLAQTDIPTMVQANQAIIGDAIILTLLAGEVEAIEASFDNLTVNNANIANVSAGKLTAGTIGTNQIYVGGSQFELDGVNTVLKIQDTQGSPVTRVELGKLGAGSTAYGITIRDASGNVILTSGSSPTISGTFIDSLSANKISAGTITGSTLQTASSGTRTVISSSNNRLQAFDSGGTLLAEIGQGSSGGYVASYATSSLNVALFGSNSAGGVAVAAAQTGSSTSLPALQAQATNNPAVTGVSAANVNAALFSNTSASSGGHGLRAVATGAGAGIVGLPAANGGFDFYAEGGGGYGPFTGAHDALIMKAASTTLGDLVVDCGTIARSGWSDSIGAALRSTAASQKGVVGVLIGRRPLQARTAAMRDLDDEEFEALQAAYDLATVNAVGEGLMVVCGEGGDIAIGDLLVTSSTDGAGMKQSDDIMRAATVAKSREAVTFAYPTETKTIACFYVCG